MLRFAPTLAAAALLAVMLAAAVPAGAEVLFRIAVKDHVVVSVNDARLKVLGGDTGGIAKAMAAKGWLAARRLGTG